MPDALKDFMYFVVLYILVWMLAALVLLGVCVAVPQMVADFMWLAETLKGP